MVCTSVPAASQVGLDVLKRGGNAIDAAIAANATLGLMEPISNGVGGDLFAIVYCAKENKLYGLNGSGRSPQGLPYEQMREEVAKLNRNFIPPTGMLPINVPGAVDGWTSLHDKFGKLTLADDLSGAISYAENGFPVTQTIAFYWGRNLAAFKGLPGAWAETYHLPGTDRAPGEGDVFKNPAASRTRSMSSPSRVATVSTTARSRIRSTPSCRPTAAICARPTLPRTIPNGSIP